MKQKRIVGRPWGRRHRGGWVILKDELVKALKDGDAVQVGDVTVGARQLRQLVSLIPCEDALIRCNGKLEVEIIERVRGQVEEGVYRTSFRKPAHNWNYFSIFNKAWVPRVVNTLVVLKPKKY